MSHLKLRKANMDDAKILFEWRNDVDTRAQSRTREPVVWQSHMRWLEKSLQNPKRILVIAQEDTSAIGTLRADLRDDRVWEISYTVAPAYRGKGFAKKMTRQFVAEYFEGKNIAADIKKGHSASESVARALGLTPYSESPSTDPNDPRPHVEWR